MNFDSVAHCNSKYDSSERNILLRLNYALVNAMKKEAKLPQFIVMVLDDDIINYARYDECDGMSTILGEYLDSLVQNVHDLINTRKSQQLPAKVTKLEYPMVYWIAAPHHKNFCDGEARTKFNLCLESVLKLYDNMRIARIKEVWDFKDLSIVDEDTNCLTPEGILTYWKAVDAALKFNITKFREFLIRKNFNELNAAHELSRRSRQDTGRFPSRNKFHWQTPTRKLPTPPPPCR